MKIEATISYFYACLIEFFMENSSHCAIRNPLSSSIFACRPPRKYQNRHPYPFDVFWRPGGSESPLRSFCTLSVSLNVFSQTNLFPVKHTTYRCNIEIFSEFMLRCDDRTAERKVGLHGERAFLVCPLYC